MHGLGIEVTLDDEVRFREALLDVAHLRDHALGDVGRLVARLVEALGAQVVVQDRRTRLHRVDGVDDVRQDLVIHLDQLERALRDRIAGRRDGGDRMAVEQRLLARHRGPGHVAGDPALGNLGEVVARHHRFHAGQRLGRRRVDRLDDRVRVRAPERPAVEHAGQEEVGAEPGLAGNLVEPVMLDGVGADDLEIALRIVLGIVENACHGQAPLISSAAAMTDRTILSYPVQRQRLPASQNRASVSVGLGFFSSSAFAATRKPGVQMPH